MEMEVHDRCRCVLRTERKAKAEARTRARASATIMKIGAIVAEAGRLVVVGLWVNATVVATGAIIRVNAGNLSNLSQSSTMMKFHQFQLETAQSLLLYHWCCRHWCCKRVIHSRSSFVDHEMNVIFKILQIIHGHQQLHQRTPQEFAPNSKLVLGSTLKQ